MMEVASSQGTFTELYAQHDRFVRSVCRTIVHGQDADDLTQQVWLAVYQHLDSFRGESKFTTWLYRIAINEAAMNHRRYNKADIISLETVHERQLPSISPQTLRLPLQQAFDALPLGYGRVIRLRSEGYKCTEIAQMLNCSTGTVKSQLFKARRALQRGLQGVA